MKLLFTSDWQTDFSNLQECEQSLDELLAAAAKYKPAAIIHAGDAKDAYSPVDVDTANFWVRVVKRVRDAGFRFIVLLGNHDRVSQSAESRNWMPILAAAGAEVVTRPKIKFIAGAAVAFVPYCGGGEELTGSTSGLLAKTSGHSGSRILVLHAEIGGCIVNASGRVGHGPTPEELGFDKWDAVFSGHVHKHQRIGDNFWYIGSPFCQDWGEADAQKGHLLATIAMKKDWAAATDPHPNPFPVKVQQLVTKIPHWYNVEYLEQHGIMPEDGAYVRSKIQVTTKKISDQLREEEERIRAKYGNVRIHTVPELIDLNADEVILRGSSDTQKIEQYVAATIPEASRFEAGQAVAYMVSKLIGLKETASGGRLEFVGVEGSNMFTFEKIKLKLGKLGLVCIRGINEDWHGRSNGSGKTSVLSLIPTIAFGQNSKGQKSDAWAYEGNDESATGRLIVRDAARRKIEIIRGRRPHLIRLLIDGEDKSSGIRGIGKKETEGLIERVLGYDWQMLMNAVYIDQAVANGFVFGTPSGRMDLIARFQNLERFEAAQKLVGDDIKKCDAAIVSLTAQLEIQSASIDELETDLKELDEVIATQWTAELKLERKEMLALTDERAAVAATEAAYKELQSNLDDLVADMKAEVEAALRATSEMSVCQDRLKRAEKLIAAKKCPTCTQDAIGVGKSLKIAAAKELAAAEAVKARHVASATKLGVKRASEADRIERWKTKLESLDSAITISRDRIVDLEKAASEEAARNKSTEEKRAMKTAALQGERRYYQAALGTRQAFGIERELLEFAKKAFHRSGIPLYLSMALCPLLNKAADEYSDIFTDGNLKVAFRVEASEFVVDVINPAGSSTVDGQSVGEAAMAGIIVAFSIREAAPKTNLLVMDEPGTGLDPEGCKQFARGILRLKDRFETILLVTHSTYIQSLLSGEIIYTVRKRHGRSRLFLQLK